MTPDESGMYELTCGRNQWVLSFDRRFIDQPAAMLQRRSVPCAVALWVEETHSYSVALLGLFEPADSTGTAGNLRVCRTTGELVFDGQFRVDTEGVRFAIHAVRRPGAYPVELEGILRGDELVMRKSVSGPVSVPKRRPVALWPGGGLGTKLSDQWRASLPDTDDRAGERR